MKDSCFINNANMSLKTGIVFMALRANVEDEHEPGWGVVYLDNARPGDMTPRSFAGHLAALERLGLYRGYGDDCFGRVWIKGEFEAR